MSAPTIDPTKTHVALEHKHARPLTACRYDPSGRYVFFGAEDNLVHRLQIETRSVSEGTKVQTVTPLAAHDSWVRAIGLSSGVAVVSEGNHGSKETTLFTGGYDGRLIAWPAAEEKPKPTYVIDAHQGWVRALAVNPSGDRVATCGNDNLVKLWDAATGKQLAQCAGHASHVYNVAFHPSGESLVSCDLKGIIKEWDASTGALKRDLTPAPALYKYDNTFRADIGGARSMAFRTDGQQLAVAGIMNVTNAFAGIGNIVIDLVNVSDGKLALELQAKDKINGVAWGVAHHPDNFWIGLAGGGGGGWLYFFKGDASNAPKDNTANEFFKLKLASDGRDLALSPDKTHVAVAHADKTLRVYGLFAKA
jgi:WD40 repeat protein